MLNSSFEIPIVFITFNRLETTKKVFEEIRKVRPKKLYLVSDEARESVDGEQEQVSKVRQYICNNIDWDCTVYKNFATENMGCMNRIVSGLNWVFSSEENAIILEDDCLPQISFFEFCETMLKHYQNDKRIMMVSGHNSIEHNSIDGDYTFAYFSTCWGWATWARAWKLLDKNMITWNRVKNTGIIKHLFLPMSYRRFERRAEEIFDGTIWDYQWFYTRIINSGYSIVPKYNLVENIGFGGASTHTVKPFRVNFCTHDLKRPVVLKELVIHDVEYDRLYQKFHFYNLRRLAPLFIPRTIVKEIKKRIH